ERVAEDLPQAGVPERAAQKEGQRNQEKLVSRRFAGAFLIKAGNEKDDGGQKGEQDPYIERQDLRDVDVPHHARIYLLAPGKAWAKAARIRRRGVPVKMPS